MDRLRRFILIAALLCALLVALYPPRRCNTSYSTLPRIFLLSKFIYWPSDGSPGGTTASPWPPSATMDSARLLIEWACIGLVATVLLLLVPPTRRANHALQRTLVPRVAELGSVRHLLLTLMETIEVYIPLLDEGTSVWRPVRAEPLADLAFRIVADQPYDTGDERWEFPPGSVVRCRPQALSGGIFLTAFELVHPFAGA